MKTLILAILLSGCSSIQTNSFVKESNPSLTKYHRFFQDDSRYPINFVQGVDNILIDFTTDLSDYNYARCWYSSVESNRVVVINKNIFNKPENKPYITEDYNSRDKFLSHLALTEYYQYKIILMSLSYCLNYGDNDTEVFKDLH